jgi:hypothetical protein
MANTSNVVVPRVGMVTDLNNLDLKTTNYFYCLNGALEEFTGESGNVQNAHSNLLAITFPTGFQVIGQIYIVEQNRVIFFLVNPTTGDCQIGEVLNCQFFDKTDPQYLSCDTCEGVYNSIMTPLEQRTQVAYCNYITIVDAFCLAFSINYPLSVSYKITSCDLRVYFTDDLNQPRHIYFDYNNNDVSQSLVLQNQFLTIIGFNVSNCNAPIYSNQLDCNQIELYPNYSRPCISFLDLLPGGSLLAGSYQFMIAYADVDGNPLTQYTPADQIIPLFNPTDAITVNTNYNTGYAILVNITNIDDTAYQYYNLVVARTIDNFTDFPFLGTFETNGTIGAPIRYVYTGTENGVQILTANDVIYEKVYYEKAKSGTTASDYYLLSNLTEFPTPQLQPAANMIKLYWQTVAIPETVYLNPLNTFNYRTYHRDEVYAFGIVFEWAWGEDSVAYHIPGRAAIATDLQTINNGNPDVITIGGLCDDNEYNQYWQVYNTGTLIGTPHQFDATCPTGTVWEWGDFSYWQSIESYPNDPTIWGSLCGTPIRFHKFPDCAITHIHDGKAGAKLYTDNNIVYPIGVQIDHQTVIDALNWAVQQGIITAEQQSQIVSYRLVRADRAGNQSIIAKGLLFDVWQYITAPVTNGQVEFDPNGGINLTPVTNVPVTQVQLEQIAVGQANTYYYPNYPYNDLRPDPFLSGTNSVYNTSTTSNGLSIPFVDSKRFTFHSPATSFANPTLGTIIKLETEEYGQSQGFFENCEGQAKEKLLSTFALTLAFTFGCAIALSEEMEKTEKWITSYAAQGTGQDIQGEGAVTAIDISTIFVPDVMDEHGNLTASLIGNVGGLLGGVFGGGVDLPESPLNPITGVGVGFPVTDAGYSRENTWRGKPHQILMPGASLFSNGIVLGIFNTILDAINIAGGFEYLLYKAMTHMQTIADAIKVFCPWINYTIQYDSVGKYNNYLPVANGTGNKQRLIDKSAYLFPQLQSINETINATTGQTTTIFVNNWHRESSVYLKYDGETLAKTQNQDTSRVTFKNAGFKYGDGFDQPFTKDAQGNSITVASFYASIKNYVPDQYGNIYKLNYIETSGCRYYLNQSYGFYGAVAFGGDVFINRFALKRKMQFFLQDRFNQLDGADVQYSMLPNVAYPNFYFNTDVPLSDRISQMSIKTIGADYQDFIGVDKSRLDGKVSKLFYQAGYMHLFNYGIPYFLVESEINVDYRYGQNTAEKDFYPNQSNLSYWLQQKNVPISEDNYYFYNTTYSKQDKESFIGNLSPDPNATDACRLFHPNRVIYSQPNSEGNDVVYDAWLVFRANNYYDFPLTDGRLISADGIESDKVLVRLENTTKIFNAYNTLQTNTEQLQIGNGGIFQTRPQEFSNTTLGYLGSQHAALLNTERGHVWVDAKRGQVFNVFPGGGGVDEISRYGMKTWFKQYLPFQIAKQFPNIALPDLDNAYNGLGIVMTFDKRFDRFFITKLDYVCLNSSVQYDPINKYFYILINGQEQQVSLSNTKYFCNASWTLSYNFETKSWISFHSFKPNYYVAQMEYFQSGIQDGINSSLWSHNVTNRSYQVYYGTLYPFTIDYVSQQSIENNFLKAIQFKVDVYRYQNEVDSFFNRFVTFNKAVVYTKAQCSGLLQLDVRNPNDLSFDLDYPIQQETLTQILVTNTENFWRFNGFNDLVKSEFNNIPFWLNTCAGDSRILNQTAFNYHKDEFNKAVIRNQQFNVRLTNDIYSNYKFIFLFSNLEQNKSIS